MNQELDGFLKAFGASDCREGSRSIGHSGIDTGDWEDYAEVPIAALEQIRAALTAEKVAAEPFPYQRTFDAIAAATSVCAGRVAISVIDFRKAFAAPQPAQPAQAATLSDAAIQACIFMICGICMTQPREAWGDAIEKRIRHMLAAHNGGKHE